MQGINFKSYLRYNKRYEYNGNIKSTLKRDLNQELTDDIIDIFSDTLLYCLVT